MSTHDAFPHIQSYLTASAGKATNYSNISIHFCYIKITCNYLKVK